MMISQRLEGQEADGHARPFVLNGRAIPPRSTSIGYDRTCLDLVRGGSCVGAFDSAGKWSETSYLVLLTGIASHKWALDSFEAGAKALPA